MATTRRMNPFLKYGVPLISLTVLGSMALAHLQQGRKDVLSARDEREWQSISATQSLNREGPLSAEQKRKKPLDLEEELRKVKIDDFDYKPIPKVRELEE